MQVILGAGGAIGIELAKLLPSYTDKVRLVGRNPSKINDQDELVKADITSEADTLHAIEGAEVAYLLVGLPYKTKLWETQWPKLMQNVINACKQNNTRLVFFDNVYVYDPNRIHHMTEDTPVNPGSKKGKVRKKIVQMIMDEVDQGNLTALIARSADFYGPGMGQNGILRGTVIEKLAAGEKAIWLGSTKYKHSFTYTPDAAKGTAILGNTKDAFNQVWHLPTTPNPMTGKEWVAAIAKELGVAPKVQAAPKFLIRLLGLFNPLMKELVEMMYQYDRDYVFDSSKFEKRFNIKPTPYLDGIKEIAKTDYRK